jgi:topoisomerase-4 subunit A
MEHPLNERYSNGSFVIDIDSEGNPLSMRLKTLDPAVNEAK